MKHRFSLGSTETKRNQTSANRGRSAFVLQSDDVRRRADEGPPKLPIRLVTVRPINGALVYTDAGTPIPDEQWSQVPISPSIVMAIKYGDLEQGEESEPKEGMEGSSAPAAGSAPQERRARRESNTPANAAQ
jgi:hypothetical protein